MSNSVIFIGSPDHSTNKSSFKVKNYTQLFLVPVPELCFRIIASFVPPITKNYRKVYVDFIGPILGFVVLTSFLVYGYSLNRYKGGGISPAEAMVLFATFMPFLCFILAKLSKSSINLYESISLVGYSLYGHLLTLLVSFIFFHETSNVFFFVCLVFFGGSSTLRLILVFLKTIPIPGARFLVCTTIAAVNMLFLIYLHFAFMHRTFSYRGKF